MAIHVKKAPIHGRWPCSEVISSTVEECWSANAGCSPQPTVKCGRYCKAWQGVSVLSGCPPPRPRHRPSSFPLLPLLSFSECHLLLAVSTWCTWAVTR